MWVVLGLIGAVVVIAIIVEVIAASAFEDEGYRE